MPSGLRPQEDRALLSSIAAQVKTLSQIVQGPVDKSLRSSIADHAKILSQVVHAFFSIPSAKDKSEPALSDRTCQLVASSDLADLKRDSLSDQAVVSCPGSAAVGVAGVVDCASGGKEDELICKFHPRVFSTNEVGLLSRRDESGVRRFARSAAKQNSLPAELKKEPGVYVVEYPRRVAGRKSGYQLRLKEGHKYLSRLELLPPSIGFLEG
jgi:hypothetical protein